MSKFEGPAHMLCSICGRIDGALHREPQLWALFDENDNATFTYLPCSVCGEDLDEIEKQIGASIEVIMELQKVQRENQFDEEQDEDLDKEFDAVKIVVDRVRNAGATRIRRRLQVLDGGLKPDRKE